MPRNNLMRKPLSKVGHGVLMVQILRELDNNNQAGEFKL